MPSNTAAWLMAPKSRPLEVKEATLPIAGENQLVVKSHAVAINPFDWAIQERGDVFFPNLVYPFISGSDISGEVVEVGSTISRFKPGDRVVGIANVLKSNAESAFQEFVLLEEHMTSLIPKNLSYEQASVIPMGLSTAASALFQKEQLGLQFPTTPAAKSTGKAVLIWGGSTSVGSNAIQLAVAAGYEVIVTASERNFEYVKSLGASQVFSYSSPTIVADLIAALKSKGSSFAGAVAIGQAGKPGPSGLDRGPAIACLEVVAALEGNKFVSCAMPPPENLPAGTSAKFMQSGSIRNDGVGKAVYVDFLEKALADGTFKAAPDATVVGKGLHKIQEAYDLQKKGVSAKKIVVSL